MLKYTKTAIERILSLPFGSIDRWEKYGYPPEAEALFNILNLFPWMIDIAETGFDPVTADYIHRVNALSQIFQRLKYYNGFLTEC